MGALIKVKFTSPVRRILSMNIHTARKVHYCMACMGDIRPGQSYVREVFVWEGHHIPEMDGLVVWKHHTNCLQGDSFREMLREEDERARNGSLSNGAEVLRFKPTLT